MFNRLRPAGLAGSGGLFLVLMLSSVVAAASVLTAVSAPLVDPTEPVVVDTTATFEDTNANGIDDDCETDVVAVAPELVVAVDEAVDLNDDGQISVSEAAQSERAGGKNCNHGGYVSNLCDDATQAEGTETEGGDEIVPAVDVTPTETAVCDAAAAEETTEDTAKVCEAPVAPAAGTETAVVAPVVTELAKNAHGKKVSAVAQTSDVGGKNCNHGGLVSLTAKDHAERDAAKAAAKEARDAAKEARAAAREARAAERATKATKAHGKAHKG